MGLQTPTRSPRTEPRDATPQKIIDSAVNELVGFNVPPRQASQRMREAYTRHSASRIMQRLIEVCTAEQ